MSCRSLEGRPFLPHGGPADAFLAPIRPCVVLAALALPLMACAPTLELPADMRANAGLQELLRTGQGGPAMQRIVAEQVQQAQQLQREHEAEEALRRAETVDYVYRPSPALFHQSVLINTFDPVGFDAQMHASRGDADADADADEDADAGDATRQAARRPPPRNAAGRPGAAGAAGAAAPARADAQTHERFWHEQREILRAGGDPQRELATFRRILAEREAMFGAVHSQVAAAIGNLGVALAAAGDDTGARALLDRALAMAEQTLGPAHPEVAIALDRLAAFHLQQGAPAAAAPLYERALAIRTDAPRLSRRLLPATLNNLGVVAARLGESGRARDAYERALAGYEAALHQASSRTLDIPERLVLEPDRPVVLSNLGVLAWQQGQTEQAIAAFARARELHDARRWAGFDTLSEAQQLAMMGTLAEEVEALAALEHGIAAGRPDATRLSLGGILEHKGRALESLARTVAAAGPAATVPAAPRRTLSFAGVELGAFGAGPDPQARHRTRAELEAVRAQMANLSLHAGSGPQAQARRAEFERLAQRERQLSGALADHVQAERQAERMSTTMGPLIEQAARGSLGEPDRTSEAQLAAQLLEAMTADAAGVRGTAIVPSVQRAIPADAALVEIATYRPLDPMIGDEARRWAPRRYAAWVLRSTGEPRSVDLGDVESIDRLVERMRRVLADPRTSTVAEVGRRLDAQVMEPVRRLAGDARHLLLAPEGALHLVPFGALQDEQGRYLVQRYTFTHLTSGRDLLRMQARPPSRQPPLIVADPDFGTRAAGGTAVAEASPARSIDFGQLEFEPLPGTAREARAIQGLLPGALLLAGASATEAAIKRVQGPRLLHVASHGFFLPDQPIERPGARAPGPRENPLLRSGLVFAGANRGASGADDGVLTALELASLDLAGTQLVTLSACETGLGDVRRGEGVFGLRRALVIAGAEAQAISLWKVDDETTEALMVDYYRRLHAGGGRSEALRQSQLAMLADPKHAHPFWWAGFIVSGDWRPLAVR